MNKYRKKPLVIEAVQFFKGERYPDVPELLYDPLLRAEPTIQILEGTLFVSEGDWLIRGVNSEVYPCKPDIFEKTYERVEE